LAARRDEKLNRRALHAAVGQRDDASVRILLASGVDRTEAAKRAAGMGEPGLLRLLNEGDASVGQLPPLLPAALSDQLEVAARRGHDQCVSYLLRLGAKPTPTTTCSAVDSGSPAVLGLLLEYRAPAAPQALMAAVKANNTRLAELLLAAGANPNTQAYGTYNEVTLLQNGYRVTQKRDPRGWHVLAIAVSNGNVELARLLLRHGAQVDRPFMPEVYEVDSPGRRGVRTDVGFADGRRIIDDGQGTITFIGCELQDHQKQAHATQIVTPLFFAALWKKQGVSDAARVAVVKLLLDAGADTRTKVAMDRAPADLIKNDPELAPLLKGRSVE
jgi:ankyrin repeat protein